MDVTLPKRGDRVRTVDGALAEVLAPSQDGKWIRVRYVESPSNPALIGSDDLCSNDELLPDEP